MDTNEPKIGTIVRRFLSQLKQKRGIANFQYKALNALAQCKTSDLGGSVAACPDCGTLKYVMHSCRDRHCPNCQGIDKELWIEARKHELLPVKYYHVVFTVPHSLLNIFRFNRQVMYDLLFEKSWETLYGFALNPDFLGAMPGAIAVLHTWDQKLGYHPHIHMIVPAGGLDAQGQWKNSKQGGDFLFDVKEMSNVFSARFVKKLRQLKQKGEIIGFVPRDLIPKPWVVYAKQAFGSPENVLEYLGRYTHRVAISNYRILKVDDKSVTFSWLDREDNYTRKEETISGVAFLERFLEHIMPPRFRRIRHYGILANRAKKQNIAIIREQLDVVCEEIVKRTRAEILKEAWGDASLLHCNECGTEMVLIQSFRPKRAPPQVA